MQLATVTTTAQYRWLVDLACDRRRDQCGMGCVWPSAANYGFLFPNARKLFQIFATSLHRWRLVFGLHRLVKTASSLVWFCWNHTTCRDRQTDRPTDSQDHTYYRASQSRRVMIKSRVWLTWTKQDTILNMHDVIIAFCVLRHHPKQLSFIFRCVSDATTPLYYCVFSVYWRSKRFFLRMSLLLYRLAFSWLNSS